MPGVDELQGMDRTAPRNLKPRHNLLGPEPRILVLAMPMPGFRPSWTDLAQRFFELVD